VQGFAQLRAEIDREGLPALERFYARVARLLAPRVATWRPLVERGPRAALEATEAQLEALARGDAGHLGASSVHRLPPPPAERRMGCCGTLGVYVGDAAHVTPRVGA
jgi:hypothetical protein